MGDSGDTSTNIASQTVDRQLSQGVDAIIGAASSSVSLTVIDKITSAGVQQVSPGEHLAGVLDLPGQGSVRPYRPAGHLPGPGPR